MRRGEKADFAPYTVRVLTVPGRAAAANWETRPLVKRQACLQALLERFDCPAVSLSEPFEDGLALLRRCREARPRRCRQQAPTLALPVWRVSRLAQGQDASLARGEPGAMAVV